MTKVLFTEQDDTLVDPTSNVPDDSLKSLMCRTEDAVTAMNKTLMQMSAQVADFSGIMADIKSMSETNMEESLERSDKLITLMGEMIAVSREIRDGLQSTTKSKRSIKPRK